jgi:hypothetical protein
MQRLYRFWSGNRIHGRWFRPGTLLRLYRGGVRLIIPAEEVQVGDLMDRERELRNAIRQLYPVTRIEVAEVPLTACAAYLALPTAE